MSEEIKVGVVGAGANTRLHHIPKLQAQDGVTVVGVCNRSRASSEAAAQEFGIPKIYAHWREAVSDPDTNAVVIGTWPYLHARVAIAALEAGKHVMTEARMARDAREAHAMLAAAQDRPELVAQVVPAPLSFGVDRTIQRLIRESWLGEVLFVEHTSAAPFLDRNAPLHWRRDRDLSGLNIAMLGIVYEMIMRWVGEASQVTAVTRNFADRALDADGRLHTVYVPDHVDALAEMACGAQMHIQQSAATALKEGGGTWLYGSEGVLRFHDGALTGARKGDESLSPVPVPEEERGDWRVEEEFVGAIRGREPIRYTSFEVGVKYMEFVEGASRSAAQGRAVRLPLVLDRDGV